MNFSEYQKEAYKAIQKHNNTKEENLHWAVGLGEETGEVLSIFKHRYYSDEYNKERLIEELGDVLWHISALCVANGIDMEIVAKNNLDKLSKRYPTGEFDIERCKNRHNLEEVDNNGNYLSW